MGFEVYPVLGEKISYPILKIIIQILFVSIIIGFK